MTIDPGLVPLAFILLAATTLLTVPLAAGILFSSILLITLNAEPLPRDFILNYSLAMRLNSPALISIPLFGLAGELAVAAGISERLLNLADALGGSGRHATGNRTIFGCTLFASVSGVGPAAVTAEGKRLIPEMLKAGHSRETAAGAIACAAGLSIIIPASVPLTVYAASIGTLTNIVFSASFVPGLLLAGGLYLMLRAHSRFKAPGDTPATEPLRTRAAALWDARWALLMPVLVLTYLFSGFFTAPEAAAFSCAYAALIGRVFHKCMAGDQIRAALDRAATTAATVLLMAGMGGLFSMLMHSCGFTDRLAEFVFSHCGGRTGSILVMNLILLLAGCFLDMPAIITFLAPLFLPLAALCSLSLPHFGVMVVMNLAIGLVTPPQAWNIAAAAKTAGIDMWSAARGALPFIAVMLFLLGLISYYPSLSLWFPELLGWPV